MTELFEPTGDADPRLVAGIGGRLGEMNRAGVLDRGRRPRGPPDGDLAGSDDHDVVLATALAVRALRHGSVGVDLATIPEIAPDLGWPDAPAWAEAVTGAALAAQGVIRHDLGPGLPRPLPPPRAAGGRRPAGAGGPAAARGRRVGARRRSRSSGPRGEPLQRAAAGRRGGPPAVDHGDHRRSRHRQDHHGRAAGGSPRFAARPAALGRAHAPTGKAAARLQEAVAEELPAGFERAAGMPTEAMTLHRLLGWRPDNATRFRHDRTNRLKYDLVVLDESSMVDLTLMARLLEALRPQTRLVLVGDPRQLTSVAAGAVLSDLVRGYEGRPDSPVQELTHNYRAVAGIREVGEALRAGDADAVLAALRSGATGVDYVETDDPASALREPLLRQALRIREAALAGVIAVHVQPHDGPVLERADLHQVADLVGEPQPEPTDLVGDGASRPASGLSKMPPSRTSQTRACGSSQTRSIPEPPAWRRLLVATSFTASRRSS